MQAGRLLGTLYFGLLRKLSGLFEHCQLIETLFNVTFIAGKYQGMFKNKIVNHQNIYLSALILLAVSLPLSTFGLSLAVIILSLNWVLEGRFKQKLVFLKERKSILIFTSLFLIHILWLLNTKNFVYGFHDLKIKLPLFLLPVIIGTTAPIAGKELKRILTFFVLAVFISTIISIGLLLGIGGYQIRNIREISLFVSHIRFSLYVVMAVFFIVLDLLDKHSQDKLSQKAIKAFILLWFIMFLFILKSITGLVLLGVFGFAFGFYVVIKMSFSWKKYIFIFSWIAVLIFVSGILIRYYQRFYEVDQVNIEKLEKYTANGNPYMHKIDDKHLENGHYLWLYVNEDELSKEWNIRSKLNYDSTDLKGQEMRYTIIRYLTSKGLRKDSSGLASLLPEEIRFIENGVANYLFVNQRSMYPLFYEVFWQFEEQKRGANPTGHSIIQHILHLKAGFGILKEHFWFGVGTGDVPDAFAEYYERIHSPLSPEVRHRAHNQFVTFFLTFGVFGFLWAMFALIYPVIKEKGFRNPYFVIFIAVSFFSLLTEDMLETSSAAMSFAFFYSIFLFASKKKQG